MRIADGSRPSILPCSAFAGFRFPPDVIAVAVRWYLRFGLSYRDVEELLTERGIKVDHVTVYRWVLRVAGGRPVRPGHRRVHVTTTRRTGGSPVLRAGHGRDQGHAG
jgi:hypothetical protein